MDLSHMRTLYEIGRITDVMAVADNKDGSWHIDCHDLWGRTLHLTTTTGDACHFTSLDAASEAAHDIGFKEIHIVEH
ncbi:hypothetical protein G8770_04900 [Aestuariicella hydrocarbonica]|uniref:Thymidylate kinase n=1 Tax=Pseudomaricurvus hydrocarbonicus TaxID=1470433 RepID=A0A9E5JSY3_9GAMM|nr:hypothetical protein [Aestuariicella hydrocarbonica]NHO64876.1 hypothetical protein [Aestuariicella hydrocarbonica]